MYHIAYSGLITWSVLLFDMTCLLTLWLCIWPVLKLNLEWQFAGVIRCCMSLNMYVCVLELGLRKNIPSHCTGLAGRYQMFRMSGISRYFIRYACGPVKSPTTCLHHNVTTGIDCSTLTYVMYSTVSAFALFFLKRWSCSLLVELVL